MVNLSWIREGQNREQSIQKQFADSDFGKRYEAELRKVGYEGLPGVYTGISTFSVSSEVITAANEVIARFLKEYESSQTKKVPAPLGAFDLLEYR